jgi:hypothetical protein
MTKAFAEEKVRIKEEKIAVPKDGKMGRFP